MLARFSMVVLACALVSSSALAQDVAPETTAPAEAEAAADVPTPAVPAPAMPPAAQAARPVVVLPFPGQHLTQEIANAALEATATELRTIVRGRDVQVVTSGEAVAALVACAGGEDIAACQGAVVAQVGGELGVIVGVGRSAADGPVRLNYEVVEPLVGDRAQNEDGTPYNYLRASADLELPADGINPAGLRSTIATLAPAMPVPPARATILIAVNVDEATVAVDGAMVGSSPVAPVEVAPGSHTVSVNRAGFRPFSRSVEVTLDGARVDADLEPDEAELERLAQVEEDAQDAAAGPKPWYKRWYVLAAAGVVLVGAAVGIGVAASGGGDDPQGFPVPPIQP